jgi:hypothetical protein
MVLHAISQSVPDINDVIAAKKGGILSNGKREWSGKEKRQQDKSHEKSFHRYPSGKS